ncbi:sensor histidine kinase LuxQ [Vibrio ichthyoenteri ATCC 700023]|uniref:Autoinducer 2 sensor kinase/phosphatase LuxQ n=1 Tax=Vibrio ichthyoenteri ATCC 700023 TaxID=870968 RepID=F9RXQ4_9VIBR|nr:quorum-sensing autoinducer 2 sensor kinase/phosphatase LuxQ [Vibrio ichthyoenteri]EGU47783.1 sensor histidine kinase LuxQ [Vibrio ichthyoenteri ATCC 700023]
MKMWQKRNGKHQLATLLTHSIFLTIGVLTLVVLLQNYQVNRQVVTQEVARSKQQTSSLIQEIFTFRLESIEIQQDSYSRSLSLVDSMRGENRENISLFFNGIDQIDPDLSPDFRFISANENMIWNDENHRFYGIEDEQLMEISDDLVTGSDWYISQTPSAMGMRYLMIRRTSLIAMNNGEVVGDLYVGIVLNNNFSLVRALLDGSNVDEVVLAVGSEIIASSLKTNTRHIRWLEEYSPQLNASNYMVSRVDLTINSVATFISVYTIQDNSHIALLMQGHYLWVAVALFVIVLIALYSRFWLGQRVSKELNHLMIYTEQSIEAKQVKLFEGSEIAEFNKIGQSFQRSFKRLREQEKQFADLFNYSLSPITLWDTSGQLLRMNPAAERTFCKSDELYQLLLDKLVPQIRMAANGASLTGINIAISDNTYRWNFSPIIIDNQTRHIMAQGQDVTSFVEAERQSKMAREEAEELARIRADFLARMSHELRTPLNGILGVSQLLKTKLSKENDIEHMDVLVNSGEHLLAVLNDILDFSKIEQGKFHIQRRDFRLYEVVNTIEKTYRPLCLENNVLFTMASNIDAGQLVCSDQIRLNQIMFNLVSNAVKFTHTGTINVSLNLVGDGEDCTLDVTVEDSGIGIDSARLSHIFEPFVQAETTTTREYGGSGLGLAIVYSLVELLDGSIWVESEIGVGTRFNITLPMTLLKDEASPVDSQLLEPPETLFDRALEVLLVEDNHTNAYIARAFCEKYGMKVTWVQDGYNAVDHLKHNPSLDLVLMDNQLPSLGGIETTQIIRDELLSSVPIFACTADGMHDTRRAFINAGANYVIVKPIKESALNKAFIHYRDHFYHSPV